MRKRETETKRAVSISEGEEMSREIVVGGTTVDGKENWEVLAQDVHHDGEKSRMYAWQKGTQTKEIFGERETCLVLEGKEEAMKREIVVYRRNANGEENCEFLAPDVHQTGEKRRMCKKLHRQKRFLERERERESEEYVEQLFLCPWKRFCWRGRSGRLEDRTWTGKRKGLFSFES